MKHDSSIIAPLEGDLNPPLELLVQSDSFHSDSKRRYTRAQEVNALAVRKYKANGRGITFQDLMSSGLAKHKSQAQNTLKRCLARNILYVIENHKPQQYFPSSLKAEIFKARLSKNAPVKVTEVPYLQSTPVSSNDAIVTQTLEGYVLPLLHEAPLNIHKLHLMTRITSEYYHEIVLPSSRWNSAKQHQEIIGTAFVEYVFYANGTVMVFIESSNNPFKLENYADLSRLIAFLGQARDRLVLFLQDRHERIVPEIMQWELKQCDINRDVKVSDWLQLTGLKIQLRHAFHLFQVYIKSKGRDIVCRVEESISRKDKNAIEAIADIFNPTERLEKRIAELAGTVNHLSELLSSSDHGSFRISNCSNIDSFDVKKGGHDL
jgi:hypothetical protein